MYMLLNTALCHARAIVAAITNIQTYFIEKQDGFILARLWTQPPRARKHAHTHTHEHGHTHIRTRASVLREPEITLD